MLLQRLYCLSFLSNVKINPITSSLVSFSSSLFKEFLSYSFCPFPPPAYRDTLCFYLKKTVCHLFFSAVTAFQTTAFSHHPPFTFKIMDYAVCFLYLIVLQLNGEPLHHVSGLCFLPVSSNCSFKG